MFEAVGIRAYQRLSMHHNFQTRAERLLAGSCCPRSGNKAGSFRFIKSKEMFTQQEIGSILSLTQVKTTLGTVSL
jgi:hypothetical protein